MLIGTMTVTVQTRWTYELFTEALATFEKSPNKTMHVSCERDTPIMMHNIAEWARSQGHKVVVEENRKSVRIQKRAKHG